MTSDDLSFQLTLNERHSRVNSSTTFIGRYARQSWVRSFMKSQHQPPFALTHLSFSILQHVGSLRCEGGAHHACSRSSSRRLLRL